MTLSSLWGSLTTTFFRGGILSTNGHVFTNGSNGQVRRQNVSPESCMISRSTVSLERLERKISATASSLGCWIRALPQAAADGRPDADADNTDRQTVGGGCGTSESARRRCGISTGDAV